MKQASIYTFPNQKRVTVSKIPCQGTLFALYNMDALLHAAKSLDAGAYKLWCYLGMNQDGYTFALSSKDAKERFGLNKAQYDNAVKKLIEQGYLVNRSDEGGSNCWFFKDEPEPLLEEEAPLFDNRTTAYDEAEQGLSGNKTSAHKEAEEEMRTCIETEQGLDGKESTACIETSRPSFENRTRNNINKINIEYGGQDSREDGREIRIGKLQAIPYSKEALGDTELVEAITSVPNNYVLVKEALENEDIPDALEERYRGYLADVDGGCIGDLIPML